MVSLGEIRAFPSWRGGAARQYRLGSAIGKRRRRSIQAITLTRQQLYELVWTTPMRTLAKRFQISDVGLKKVCTRHRIPVPARGHWQKLHAGKESRRIPLPAMKNPPTISLMARPTAETTNAEPSPPDPAVEIEKTFPPVEVVETLARPHAVTVAMRQELKRQQPDDYGAIHCVGPDVLSARIHPGSIDRLIGIADALLKGFVRRGFELRSGKRGARIAGGLQVIVDEEVFAISIEERMRRETHKPTEEEASRRRRGLYLHMKSYDYAPTGELSLKIEPCFGSGLQSTWRDTRHQRIEGRLCEVMVSLRRHAALRKAERERAQRRTERFEREQQRRADLRARVEAERSALAGLERDADAWHRAERIRAFVSAVEKEPRSLDDPEQKAWANWARNCADRLDPLETSAPSLLDTPEAEMQPISLWQFNGDED